MYQRILSSRAESEEQVSCIIQNLAEICHQIFVIHHSDKYGHVIKNSFSNLSKILMYQDLLQLNFLKYMKI